MVDYFVKDGGNEGTATANAPAAPSGDAAMEDEIMVS